MTNLSGADKLTCQELQPHEVRVGLSARFEFKVTESIVERFSEFSGDWNPFHNDTKFAASLGYSSRVAHGASSRRLLAGLLVCIFLENMRVSIR